MKILVLASLAYSLVNFRRDLLIAMTKAGHEVIACAPEEDAAVIADLKSLGIAYRPVPMARAGRNPFADLATLSAYIRLMRSERPDTVLAYTQKPIIYGGIAARIAGISRFFAMVSGLGYAFTNNRRVLRFVVSALYRLGVGRASAIFVFNGDDRGEMLRNGIVREDQCVVQIPGSGIDTARFQNTPVPEGTPVFLLIARLLRDKGLFEYVEAARQVKRLHPEAKFRILGPLDPNPTAISRDEVDRRVEEGIIEYLGETRDVRPHLQAATVYVLPSYREGLPRTVLEAMATGRAIITTDAPGCREPVSEGVNGFIVPVRNPAALADAMMRFVKEPALAGSMGKASRRLAEEIYDVHKVNALLLKSMSLEEGSALLPQPSKGRDNPVRRGVDIAIAGLAVIAALPVMTLAALAIRLSMGGPVLFVQPRAGRHGRSFPMVKFRTMTDRRDAYGRLLPDQDRMTPLGRFLRQSRIDELPELWNVIRGEMAIVGPRPLLPETVEEMGADGIRRGLVRPGLTGWAQVNGNARLGGADKLALDLWYIDHASPALDLRIIFKTVGVILTGERINRSEVGRAYAGGHSRRG